MVALQERAREAELERRGGGQPVELGGREPDVEAAEVVGQLGGAAGADDGDDRAADVLLADPADGHLGGRPAELGRDGHDLGGQVVDPGADLVRPRPGRLPLAAGPVKGRAPSRLGRRHVLAGELARLQHPPGGDGQAEGGGQRQELALHPPVRQRPGDLEAAEGGPAAQLGQGDRASHGPGGGVGYAHVQDLARPDEVVEGADDLLHRRHAVPHVQPEQVQVVGAEPLQAGLDRPDQVLAVVAAGVGVVGPGAQAVLGGQHEVVAVGGHQLPDDPLAGPVGVVVGGVDEVAAGLGVGVEHLEALVAAGPPAPVGAEGHGPEGQLGHAQAAAAEQAVAHGHGRSSPGAVSRDASRAVASATASRRSP